MKFGFIVHPFNISQLRAFAMNTGFLESVGRPDRMFKVFLDENRHVLDSADSEALRGSRESSSLPVHVFERVVSASGRSTSGIIVAVPLLPDEILNDQKRAVAMVAEACRHCAEWGADVVGLGAYTAIIGSRGEKVGQLSPVPVTTGNSYTVWSAVAGLESVLGRIGVALEGIAVVVGYQGSIGLAISKMLARKGVNLVLVGRGSGRLIPQSLAEVVQQTGIQVETCNSVEEGVGRSRIVVSATSSGQVIRQEWLLPGSVVFDVAQPRDVIGRAPERPDVLIIDGGLAEFPEGTTSSLMSLWTHNSIFGCLAETMILALEDRPEPFSIGRELSLEKIKQIGRLGEEHGFGARNFLSFGVPVRRGDFTRRRKWEFRRSPNGDDFLVSARSALNASGNDVYRRYRNYMDPFVASVLNSLDLEKNYVKAEGVFVWDENGDRYLDFASGFGAVNTGHNHPRVIEAVTAVMNGKLPNFLKPSVGQLTTALAETLAHIAPGDLDTSFFGNSGAEANEGALKLARLSTGRRRLLHAEGSFHGKTFGALSVTDNRRFRSPFRPLLHGCRSVPFGALDALESALSTRDVAAFIVEPVQGEGGVVVPPKDYLSGAKALCARYGTLLIADEVQTGFGRTGAMFASEHSGVEPDIMTVAKTLSGGLIPIGAFVTKSDIWDEAFGNFDTYNTHTSTFGGSNLAAAAGLAAIEVIREEGLVGNAADLGRYFLGELEELKRNHRVVRDVRGMGLMIGIEFEDFLGRMIESPAAREFLSYLGRDVTGKLAGLSASIVATVFIMAELLNTYRLITHFTLHRGLTLRVQPPLTVTKDEVDYFVESLDKLCERLSVVAGMCEELDSAGWSR